MSMSMSTRAQIFQGGREVSLDQVHHAAAVARQAARQAHGTPAQDDTERSARAWEALGEWITTTAAQLPAGTQATAPASVTPDGGVWELVVPWPQTTAVREADRTWLTPDGTMVQGPRGWWGHDEAGDLVCAEDDYQPWELQAILRGPREAAGQHYARARAAVSDALTQRGEQMIVLPHGTRGALGEIDSEDVLAGEPGATGPLSRLLPTGCVGQVRECWARCAGDGPGGEAWLVAVALVVRPAPRVGQIAAS